MSKRPADAREVPASPKRQRAEPPAGFRLRQGLPHSHSHSHSQPEPGAVATAAAFRATHASWEAFEAALRAYAQATCQLYVVRTTTSVRRRNQRISESLAGAEGQSQSQGQAQSVPERFGWYSKTLVCTHGWKDRRRGSGKRALTSVRSTCCPARMCVTLQHRGAADADWQVVVTKHVRTHNHPLSRELYLYYTENRRIYDPELLAGLGDPRPADQQPADPAPFAAAQDTMHEAKEAEAAQAEASFHTDAQHQGEIATLLGDNARGGAKAEVTVAQMIADATSGGLAMQEQNQSLQAPKVGVKTHASWEDFHSYIAEYSKSTNQVFRTRSTISVSAKNAKVRERVVKAGRIQEDKTTLEIPANLKWYSKMLICNHGWKRKSRSKSLRDPYSGGSDLLFGESECKSSTPTNHGACPAILLARLERDIHDSWRVVINRQVTEHNHSLTMEIYDSELPVAASDQLLDANADGTGHPTIQPPHSSDASSQQHGNENEVVVRVPKLQAVFSSWEEFHASLKVYSDATFQLYCTRTTTSVECRNRKIVAMQQQAEAEKSSGATVAGVVASTNANSSDTRLIPEEWKWYNKTLMCTHGWKRRPRGQGKRTAHVVHSTLCPVKLCATVQYIELINVGDHREENRSGGGWRVVITRHVVDHNHNLSRELYEHYRENRRIYDPELLTIDEGNEGAIIKRRAIALPPNTQPSVYGLDPSNESVAGSTADAALDESEISCSTANQVTDSSVSMSMITASATPGNPGADSIDAHLLPIRIHPGSHPIPSVVILPYQNSTTDAAPMLLDPISRSSNDNLSSAFSSNLSTGDGVAALTALAAPQQQIFVPYRPTESESRNVMATARQSSVVSTNLANNLFTLACPIHSGNGHDEGGQSGVACTCFRLAGSAQYVNIAPSRASQPQTPHRVLSYDLGDGDEPHDNFSGDANSALMAEGNVDPDLDITSDAWVVGTPLEIPPRIVLDTGESVWRVAAMIRRHTDWKAFHNYLDAYSAATFQLFSVRTTTSVRSRYARIAQQMSKKQADQPPDTPLNQQQLEQLEQVMPADFEWYSKTFLCTHGWKRRRRGAGKRVGHTVRSTQCPAKLCATLQRSAYGPDGTKGAKKWCVVVTKQIFDHNHELSETAYQRYSENRRIKDPEVLREAEALWRSGSTRREVFEYLKERVPNVAIVMKDVHNIVQRWKSKQDSVGSSNVEATHDTSILSSCSKATE